MSHGLPAIAELLVFFLPYAQLPQYIVDVGSRDPVYSSCAVELLRLVTSDDIMTSLLKKLPISIRIDVVKPLWSLSGQFPNCRPKPSAVVVSYSCELCSHGHTADADATQLDSCVASASAVCIEL